MNLKRKKGLIFSSALSIILALIITFVFTITCFAGDIERTQYNLDSLNKNEFGRSVMSVTLGAHGDGGTISLDDTADAQVGLDVVYGLNTRKFSYFGEVPSADNTFDELKDYPHSKEAYGRVWYNNPTDVSGELTWDKDEGTKDIHAKNLTFASNVFEGLTSQLTATSFNIIATINGVVNSVVKALIGLSNLDITSLVEALNLEKLLNILNQLFLKNGSSLSPLFILVTSAFIMSFAFSLFKYVKSGTVSFMAVLKEFSYFLIGILLAAMAFTGGLLDLTSTCSNAAVSLISQMSTTEESTLALFKYDTGNKIGDSNDTYGAISNKPFVDLLIKNEFGYNSNELVLFDDNDGSVCNENWGITNDQMKSIIAKINTDGDQNLFAISNKSNGELVNADAPNLGYYWYATCSNVNAKSPFSITKTTSGDSTTSSLAFSNGDQNKLLFIPDLLAAIDAETGGSSKCNQIMGNMRLTTLDTGGMFLVLLVSIALMLALLVGVAFSVAGKIIFVAGVVFIPVLSVLTIAPSENLRAIAKGGVFTWMASSLKMLAGLAYILLTLTFSSILCENGTIGTLLDIVFLILMFVFAPKIFTAMNNAVDNSAIGKNQLDVARRVSNNASRALSNAQNRSGLLNSIKHQNEKREELSRDMDNLSQTVATPTYESNAFSGSKDSIEAALNNYSSEDKSSEQGVESQNYNGEQIFLNGEELEELNIAEDKANQRLAAFEALKDSERAKALGISDKDYIKACENLESAKDNDIAKKREKLTRMNNLAQWKNSKIGLVATAIPVSAAVVNTYQKVLTNDKLDVAGKLRERNIQALESDKLLKSTKVVSHIDSNGVERKASVSAIIAAQTIAEKQKIKRDFTSEANNVANKAIERNKLNINSALKKDKPLTSNEDSIPVAIPVAVAVSTPTDEKSSSKKNFKLGSNSNSQENDMVRNNSHSENIKSDNKSTSNNKPSNKKPIVQNGKLEAVNAKDVTNNELKDNRNKISQQDAKKIASATTVSASVAATAAKQKPNKTKKNFKQTQPIKPTHKVSVHNAAATVNKQKEKPRQNVKQTPKNKNQMQNGGSVEKILSNTSNNVKESRRQRKEHKKQESVKSKRKFEEADTSRKQARRKIDAERMNEQNYNEEMLRNRSRSVRRDMPDRSMRPEGKNPNRNSNFSRKSRKRK